MIVIRNARGDVLARSRNRSNLRWTALAGVLALALHALVPVHLAFDLGEELGGAHHPVRHDAEWRVLAKLIGHDAGDADDGDADHGHHHDPTCPVLAAFGALTGLVAASMPTLAQPVAVAVTDLAASTADRPTVAPTLPYRSRAPPLA
jgi:Protein of unknown function (DUF2946)